MMDVPSGSARRIGRLAVQALLLEAGLAPKPGLVTPFSTGAHSDMDHPLFVASARALEFCFTACAWEGERAIWEPSGSGGGAEALLGNLRAIGRAGEVSMLRVTGGVNTHKGAIFCLGLLCAAAANRLVSSGKGEDSRRDLGNAACGLVATLCAGLVQRDLGHLLPGSVRSYGERLYLEHGVRGARGQAEDGYPLLRKIVLPRLRKAWGRGPGPLREACLRSLVCTMTELEDSCLLARGGPEGLAYVRRHAAMLHHADAGTLPMALKHLDEDLCRRRLSPGGSADMLSAGIFLVSVERDMAMSALGSMPDSRVKRIA